MDRMLGAVLSLTSHLELGAILQELVETAATLTGARYAAMGVLDAQGNNEAFVYTGMDNEFTRSNDPPRGHGVLGAIPEQGALILSDLTTHEDFGGFPPGHPPMFTFLGVPLQIRDEVYGRIYLSEKPGGFTPDDASTVQMLAAAAAIAVQNARLYTTVSAREQWLRAGQDVTNAMLSGAEVEDVLTLIATRSRSIAGADTAVLVLPGMGTDWVIEVTDGDQVGDLVGIVLPENGRGRQVIESGTGLVVDSFARAKTLRVPEFGRYGPSLYAPMTAEAESMGLIILLRHRQAPEFSAGDLQIAESFARQAALALQLAEARQAQERALVLDERARIARDLHDLAIQQLFATGLQLSRALEVSTESPTPADAVLTDALDGVDESVRQIRTIVRELRSPDERGGLVNRLEREVSLARTGLGFAPSLVLDRDGPGPVVLSAEVDARIGDDLADDVVAVVREGLANAARHARAASVHIGLVLGADRIGVTITDDGIGVGPTVQRSSGLANLDQRARRHGGSFSWSTPPDGGTRLDWSVTLD